MDLQAVRKSDVCLFPVFFAALTYADYRSCFYCPRFCPDHHFDAGIIYPDY